MSNQEPSASLTQRLTGAAWAGLRTSRGTIWFLLRIMIPVSLVVSLLGWSGLLAILSRYLAPAMGLIGLPGEGALALLSGVLLNNYSALAVAGGLSLDLRAATIIAIFCLTAHNLIVETTVMKKTGSSAFRMVALRLGMAIASAFILNLLLPASLSSRPFSAAATNQTQGIGAMLLGWALSTGRMTLKIVILVVVIMVGQRLLEEFRVTEFLSRLLAPIMRVFGLSRDSSFLWIVINTVGYAYGAGIIVEEVERGKMKPQDADLFNHHAAVCHSLLEDTALFASLGVPLLWITIPRISVATAVVWAERFRRHYFRRSFRAGVSS